MTASHQGAAKELVAGDPSDLATDLGPVIDREAFDGIQTHLARLRAQAKPLVTLSAGAPSSQRTVANLIAPHAFEVASIADMSHEIFGPVLHIVRWSGDPLAVIDQINALGYGLTIGIQTRIDSRAQAITTAPIWLRLM